MSKLWFKRKKYGWGWVPSSWEGWFITISWILLFSVSINNINLERNDEILFIVFIIGLLFYICYKKGEKPKWQWGKEKEIEKD